ncbi:FAD-binding oxidoreductase [Rhizobium metallidurans]|uniref:D-lactate dehydrogenase (Cytochrome) n=1 Tax=Rhizobium metallidurans TaxID=1265931 RepID=A0A7W6CTI8_9HYPH|nr:FAD-binding oxidoreductase [Rhizobium metallidurans]MBB3966166.1 D-lactate dehydrogenase (cytochrome) [Rhizobium metallidurans]
MDIDKQIVAEIEARLGAKNIRTGADAEGFLEDFWGRARGKTLCVALPASTQEVSDVLSICFHHKIAVFPQGGNTSTCLGAVPDASGRSIVLSLSRMNRILSVDPLDASIAAEAGCILADIQEAAVKVDKFFPLSLGAEGSCQIGGNVSTNAGGTSVLRYGNTRDLVLGMEVVLPDGRIWDGMRTLRKNNTGYDLKHLFIGAEGSLGIITKVSLKIFPSLPHLTSALISFEDIVNLTAFTEPLRKTFDTSIIAMELISGSEVRIVKEMMPDLSVPYDQNVGWFLLVDIVSDGQGDIADRLQDVLGGAMEDGHITDVLISANEAQRAAIWKLRHSVTESHKKYGMGMSHDVAVPIGDIPRFIQIAKAKVDEAFPQADIAIVGHVGDGNLHYNVIFEKSRWAAIPDQSKMRKDVYKVIYDIAAGMNGTFSAEHGIGALHVAEMKTYKSEIELEMMKGVKSLFDPHNIMNPGRILPE